MAVELDDRKLGENVVYEYPGGLVEYLNELLKTDDGDTRLIEGQIMLKDDAGIPLTGGYAIAIAPSNTKTLETYVNGVKTTGGSHVNGIRRGALAAVKDALQNNRVNLNADDVMGSVAMVAHIMVPGSIVEFEGQTKDVLAVAQVTTPLKNAIATALGDALFDDQSTFRSRIIEATLLSCSQRADIEKLREQTRNAKSASRNRGLQLSSKLKKAQSRKPEERELYLVEGDSASRIGRDPKTQAVLPLRGKVINALKTDPARMLKNSEVSTIVAALGAGVYGEFDLDKIQYHKLVAACFTGDTEVKLVDGRVRTLEQLAATSKTGYQVWAKTRTGEIVAADVEAAFKTRTVNRLIEVTLDNDKTITCTPDHMFMTAGGELLQADELSLGAFLSALSVVQGDDGEQVYDETTQDWIDAQELAQRAVTNAAAGIPVTPTSGMDITSVSDRRRQIARTVAFLMKTGRRIDPVTFEFWRSSTQVTWHDLIEQFGNADDAVRAAWGFIDSVNPDTWKAVRCYSQRSPEARARVHAAERLLTLLEDEQDVSNMGRMLSVFDSTNPKIAVARAKSYARLSMRQITGLRAIYERRDVYCLSVPEYGNFALNAGVFVHNCDRDADGHHIQSLLIGMAFKLFPGFIEAGHMYVAEAPLFKATRYVNGKPEHRLFYSDAEINAVRDELKGYTITRFKGLGEMNESEAHETLANPETRRLVQLTVEDAKRAERALDMLVGNDAAGRRDWVLDHIGVPGFDE